MQPITIQDVEKKINEVYLIVDEGLIRIIYATVIANRLNLSDAPVWLLLLAGSSGGKTAILKTLDKCGAYITPVDTLTTNTFASALSRDEEVSLLHKANNGILVFKDFTTLTSMNEKNLDEIMGQMRAIYDGKFNKKTGNANDIDWDGKIGIIAAGTISVQIKMRQYSENGERFLNYIINVADPLEMTERAMKNQKDMKQKEDEIADMVAEFINQKLSHIDNSVREIPKSTEYDMIRISNFCTHARSPVMMNKKNPQIVDYVPEREMPMRMAMMMKNMAVALMWLCDEEVLSKLNANILYKVALDSIPVQRRIVLRILGEYREASTRDIAIRLNYTTETVRVWLTQLNALKIIDRTTSSHVGAGDAWKLKPEYKDLVCEYENIIPKDDVLTSSEDAISTYNAYVTASDVSADSVQIDIEDDPFYKLL